MSKRDPAYSPLCNKHIRFYLADTNRQAFNNDLAEKQFRAVEKVFNTLSQNERNILTLIMPMPERTTADLIDSYIMDNLRRKEVSTNEVNRFWILLRHVNRLIAIEMGYIEESPERNRAYGK